MRTLPKYLTQDELKRFFSAIDSPRDRALFGLIYHYGLRVDEATQLTVDDVNLKEHRIWIRRLKNGLAACRRDIFSERKISNLQAACSQSAPVSC